MRVEGCPHRERCILRGPPAAVQEVARIRIIARFHARQRPLSEEAAPLRELGIAFLSKLEQLSQRARLPVAREKDKNLFFRDDNLEAASQTPLRTFIMMYNPGC